MTDSLTLLVFAFGIVCLVGIFAVFCICMHLREFPKFNSSTSVDLEKKTYETKIEIDKAVENKIVIENTTEWNMEIKDNGSKK